MIHTNRPNIERSCGGAGRSRSFYRDSIKSQSPIPTKVKGTIVVKIELADRSRSVTILLATAITTLVARTRETSTA
jgi:hypothetical protein